MQKNKTPHWAWIAVIVVAIIFVVIYLISKNKKLSVQRIQDVLLQKQKELAVLTEEFEKLQWKKKLIDSQVDRMYIFLKALLVFIIACINIVLICQGAEPINTALNTFGTICLLYNTTMFIARKKIFDINVYQQIAYNALKIWFYKRYDFEMKQLTDVREMINNKQIEVAKLQAQII